MTGIGQVEGVRMRRIVIESWKAFEHMVELLVHLINISVWDLNTGLYNDV